MPKVIGEIKKFNIGIVSTVDEHDIPPDASQYNENIETLNTDGKLKGRRKDVSLIGGYIGEVEKGRDSSSNPPTE